MYRETLWLEPMVPAGWRGGMDSCFRRNDGGGVFVPCPSHRKPKGLYSGSLLVLEHHMAGYGVGANPKPALGADRFGWPEKYSPSFLRKQDSIGDGGTELGPSAICRGGRVPTGLFSRVAPVNALLLSQE